MPELSLQTKKLVAEYEKNSAPPIDLSSTATIHVDEAVSKVASFYEHVRTIIDWKEEHLMRRAAIVRKLRRRFIETSGESSGAIAEPLVIELIRGGYFPNDTIKEAVIPQIQRTLEKYFSLIAAYQQIEGNGLQAPEKILEIAACEIEELLAPSPWETTLVDYMFNQMQGRIKINDSVWKQELLKPEETNIQIYIAVWRAIFKLDDSAIRYQVLTQWYPFWRNPSLEQLIQLQNNIANIMEALEKAISRPVGRKFYAVCQLHHTPYLLLGDIMRGKKSQEFQQILDNPEQLEAAIRKAYETRRLFVKEKITRAAVYATASIFITKILSLVILEVAIAALFKQPLNTFFLVVDVVIPTLLMAALVSTIRTPPRTNANLAVMETVRIVYATDTVAYYEVKAARRPGPAMRTLLAAAYSVGTVISFVIIFWLLRLIGLPVISSIIDVVFIALILFAGNAIRNRAQELVLRQEKEGIGSMVADMFFLPLASTGRWLSDTWRQYNVITLFFSALVDMPFSNFLEFLDGWRQFLRERREELQ